MATQDAILTMIHDKLGQVLADAFAPGGANPISIIVGKGKDDALLSQLEDPKTDVPRMSLSFAADILTTSVSVLLGALPTPDPGRPRILGINDLSQLLQKVRQDLGNRLGLFEQQLASLSDLIAARDPAHLGAVIGTLFESVSRDIGDDPKNSVARVQQLIGNDLGAALPFTTVLGAAKQGLKNVEGIPKSVERALLQYFFTVSGYMTVDGESVVSPVHISDLGSALAKVTGGADPAAGALQSLKGLFSKTTAERYLRDTTRVIVESAYDAGRGFRGVDGQPGVYDAVVAKLTNRDKFVAWFRGFSSMTESAAMRAVEIGTQGVSEFQTNPLIAAAAGSFAGSVARKLGQDSFLALLRKDLGI